MSEFWVSVKGQVLEKPLGGKEVQHNINAGVDCQLMKVGETEWKTAADYGFSPTEDPKPEPKKTEFKAVSPEIFWGDKHFCFVHGKTEMDRKRQSLDLADFLNKNNYKPL